MKVDVEDFESGIIDVFIGLKKSEIDAFIKALHNLKKGKDHFHFRSLGTLDRGISDIEFFCLDDNSKDNMKIDDSPIIKPNR